MAGEKITLEVLTKFVDKGLKQAKKEIKQLYDIEKRRQDRSLKDTAALYKANKITLAQFTRAVIRYGENRLKAQIGNNRKIRAHTTTTYKRIIAKAKEADKILRGIESSRARMHKRWAAQKQAIEKVTQKNIAQGDRLVAQRKLRDARERQQQLKRTHKQQRAEARKTAAVERKKIREIDNLLKRSAKNRLARTKKTEQRIRAEARRTAQIRRQSLGGMKQGYSSIISTLGQLTIAAGIAGYALVSAAKKVLSVGATFEQSIVNVGAIANMTDHQMTRIGRRARELGAQTAYTATEVANGMADLARAGLKANDIMGAIGPTLYLAGAAGAEMTQATKLMARTMAQFGLNATDATNVADTFTLAMQNSLLDIESLDSSMRYAGAAAGAFGWDIQQTTAAVSLFMDQTGMGSTAGTQFRHVLLSLAGPTAAAKKVIGELAKAQGLTYKQMEDRLNPQMSDFATILESLKPVMNDHNKILKLVNKRSSGTLQKILKDYHAGQSKYDELTTMFAKGGGAALITYDKQMGTVLGKQKIVASKIQEAMLQLFTAQSGPISVFLDWLMVQMDDVILVFDAMSRVITDNLTVAFQEFQAGVGGTRSAGEQVAALLIQITQSVVWFIKNLPKIVKNIYNATVPLLKIAFIVKGLTVAKSFIGIVGGISTALMTRLFPAILKVGNLAIRVGTRLGGLGKTIFTTLVGGGVFGLLYFGVDLLMGMMNPLESAMDGVSEKMMTSTEEINEQTDALRKAREEYERFKETLGGGELATGSVAEIKRTTTSMLEKADDENLKDALLKQKNIDVAKVKQQTELGELIYTDDDLITDKMKTKLKELSGENNRFLVSMDVLYATAKSLSDEEHKNFKKNLKNKAEELKKFQSSISRFSKIEAAGMRESLSERIRGEALGGNWGRYGRGSREKFLKKDEKDLSEREKRLKKEIELAETLETTTLFIGDEDNQIGDATKVYKLVHHGLEGEIEARLQILGILEDQKNVLATVGDIEEEDKLKNMSAIIDGLSTKLKDLGEVDGLDSTQIDNLSKSLIDFYGETGSYANAEKEITSVLSAAGKSSEEINKFSSEIMGKLKLIEMSPERIRRDMEKLMDDGYDIFGPDQMKNLVGSGIILNDLIKKSEELGETQGKAYGNVARALIVEKEILGPLEQQYAMAKKYGNLTTQQRKDYDKQYKRMTETIEKYNKALIEGHVAHIAILKEEISNLWTDPDVTPFIEMLKNIGGVVVGSIETLETPVDPEKEARDKAEQDRKNKEYVNKLRSFYQKLYNMERKQRERIEKLQEDETDSLANELKRRIKKTKEFFAQGYKLLRNNAKRTRELERREQNLIDQMRLEARLKTIKKMEEENKKLDEEFFNLTANETQKQDRKVSLTEEEAAKERQTRINEILETGLAERNDAILKANKELEDSYLKPIDPNQKSLKRDKELTVGMFGKEGSRKKAYSVINAAMVDGKLASQEMTKLREEYMNLRKEGELSEEQHKDISKRLKEQIALHNESIKQQKLYAALLKARTEGKIGKADTQGFISNFPDLDPDLIKGAIKTVNRLTRKSAKTNLKITKDFTKNSIAVHQTQVDAIENQEKDLSKAIDAIEDNESKKNRNAGKKRVDFHQKNVLDPILEMEKAASEILNDTQGDQLKREWAEEEKKMKKVGYSYEKRLEMEQAFLNKRKALIQKEAIDAGQVDPFAELDLNRPQHLDKNAKWWQSRAGELASTLKGGADINAILQRAFDIEMQALSPDIFGMPKPEETRERLMAEADTLRQLAQMYRDHEKEKRDHRLKYSMDEEEDINQKIKDIEGANLPVSEEELDLLYKKLELINKGKEEYVKLLGRQEKEEKEAGDAAEESANDLAKGIKGAAEKIAQYWQMAFGPLYIAYKALMFLKNVLGKIVDKIKQGLDFLTGGNLELNPFTLMTEAAQKLIEHIEQVQEEQKELEELFRAGRISAQEYELQKSEIDEKSADEIAKETIDEMIEDSMRFMDALIAVAPTIMDELVKQLPKLISALERIIPQFVKILDRTLPIIMPVLIKIFTVCAQVFAKVVGELLGGYAKKKTGNMASGATMGAGIGALLAASVTGGLGAPAGALIGGAIGTAAGLFLPGNGPVTFNDTPRPVRVTNSGLLARFAPGDTVIAAKEPQELMRQALMAVSSDIKMGVTKPPSMPSSATQGRDSGGGSRIDIAVIAEGRVLDAVQMQAMERGHAPKIEKRLRKASGVKVGFNRGRYNKFAVNT